MSSSMSRNLYLSNEPQLSHCESTLTCRTVLGIETSGLSGSVALVRDGVSLECRSLDQPGRRHAQSLVLEIRDMLAAHQLTPSQVDAVAVSRGPGSFTGLRVGLVCAKTFAFATGCRFVAVDTFIAVAMNCPPEIHDLWVVDDAQRGDLVAGRYLRTGDTWQLTAPVAIVEAEDWLSKRTSEEVITGRGLLRYDVTAYPGRYLTSGDTTVPLASSVAQLGIQMLQAQDASSRGDDFDFWKSIPFYMRPSAAEETHDRKAAISAAQ